MAFLDEERKGGRKRNKRLYRELRPASVLGQRVVGKSGIAIKYLPLSVEHLTSLIELDLRDCKNLSIL